MEQNDRKRRIYTLTLFGSFINLLLVIFKFIAGFLGNSTAMVADAVHSLSDFITDFIVLIFIHISSKPSDEHHDFGHGKYETLASSIIGIVLMLVAGGLFWSGVEKIWTVTHGGVLEAPSMIAFWAAIVSIALKEMTYWVTIYYGRSLQSKALEVNAWHHRSDALSSIGTALGVGGAIWLGESWRILDPIAAVVVSVFIVKVAYVLIKTTLDELLECSLPKEVEDEIERMVLSIGDVTDVHKMQTRQIGNGYAINMHVRMDGHISLIQAHDKSMKIERLLKSHYGPQTQVSIHVEPLEQDYKKLTSKEDTFVG